MKTLSFFLYLSYAYAQCNLKGQVTLVGKEKTQDFIISTTQNQGTPSNLFRLLVSEDSCFTVGTTLPVKSNKKHLPGDIINATWNGKTKNSRAVINESRSNSKNKSSNK